METFSTAGRIIEPADIQKLRQQPVVSERALIDRAIRYANAGDVKSWASFVEGIELPESVGSGAQFMASFAPEREAFRSALTAIVMKDTTPALVADWRRRAEGLILLPTFGQGHVSYRLIVIEYFSPPLGAQFAYVLLLLLDPERPFGRDLCQCRLEGCGRFFFTSPNPKGGRPQRLYCNPTHMHMAHEATAPERVRRSRENRKRSSKKRRA
jgi:hypothetical protein